MTEEQSYDGDLYDFDAPRFRDFTNPTYIDDSPLKRLFETPDRAPIHEDTFISPYSTAPEQHRHNDGELKEDDSTSDYASPDYREHLLRVIASPKITPRRKDQQRIGFQSVGHQSNIQLHAIRSNLQKEHALLSASPVKSIASPARQRRLTPRRKVEGVNDSSSNELSLDIKANSISSSLPTQDGLDAQKDVVSQPTESKASMEAPMDGAMSQPIPQCIQPQQLAQQQPLLAEPETSSLPLLQTTTTKMETTSKPAAIEAVAPPKRFYFRRPGHEQEQEHVPDRMVEARINHIPDAITRRNLLEMEYERSFPRVQSTPPPPTRSSEETTLAERGSVHLHSAISNSRSITAQTVENGSLQSESEQHTHHTSSTSTTSGTTATGRRFVFLKSQQAVVHHREQTVSQALSSDLPPQTISQTTTTEPQQRPAVSTDPSPLQHPANKPFLHRPIAQRGALGQPSVVIHPLPSKQPPQSSRGDTQTRSVSRGPPAYGVQPNNTFNAMSSGKQMAVSQKRVPISLPITSSSGVLRRRPSRPQAVDAVVDKSQGPLKPTAGASTTATSRSLPYASVGARIDTRNPLVPKRTRDGNTTGHPQRLHRPLQKTMPQVNTEPLHIRQKQHPPTVSGGQKTKPQSKVAQFVRTMKQGPLPPTSSSSSGAASRPQPSTTPGRARVITGQQPGRVIRGRSRMRYDEHDDDNHTVAAVPAHQPSARSHSQPRARGMSIPRHHGPRERSASVSQRHLGMQPNNAQESKISGSAAQYSRPRSASVASIRSVRPVNSATNAANTYSDTASVRSFGNQSAISRTTRPLTRPLPTGQLKTELRAHQRDSSVSSARFGDRRGHGQPTPSRLRHHQTPAKTPTVARPPQPRRNINELRISRPLVPNLSYDA